LSVEKVVAILCRFDNIVEVQGDPFPVGMDARTNLYRAQGKPDGVRTFFPPVPSELWFFLCGLCLFCLGCIRGVFEDLKPIAQPSLAYPKHAGSRSLVSGAAGKGGLYHRQLKDLQFRLVVTIHDFRADEGVSIVHLLQNREIVTREDIRATQDYGALKSVLEFPYVAAEVVLHQSIQSSGAPYAPAVAKQKRRSTRNRHLVFIVRSNLSLVNLATRYPNEKKGGSVPPFSLAGRPSLSPTDLSVSE
jgi:hypothetical protein